MLPTVCRSSPSLAWATCVGLPLFLWLALPAIAADAAKSTLADVATAATAAPLPGAASDYRVGSGDELNFHFHYTPELNTVAKVRADGRVTLPMLGEMSVAGATLRELAERIQDGLANRVRRPDVAINVQGAITSQRVFVGGEVARPGVQPLIGALTAAQAVMAAEGLKDTAQPREVTVLRGSGTGSSVALRVDLAGLLDGSATADLTLVPGDVVIVPRSGIANVGVWVDQYVRRVIPINFGFGYTIDRNGVNR